MKRLLVTCDYPPVSGGQSRYLAGLWGDINSQENILLLPSRSRPTESASPANWRFFSAPAGEDWFSRFVRLAVLLWKVLQLVITEKPNQVQFGQLVVGGICGLVVKRLTGIPFCVFCYGADFLEFSRHRIGKAVLSRIFSQSSAVFACSTFTAAQVQRFAGGQTRVKALLPSVDPRFFEAGNQRETELRKEWDLHENTVLLTVGRLVERKGHDIVLKALPYIKQNVPNVHYVIVGDGPERSRLEELADHYGVRDDVSFRRGIPDEDLPSVYRLAKAFVMVPRYLEQNGNIEGFGIVYIEANAAGVPVVGARTGGVEDAIRHGDTGLLVDDPLDAQAVARAVTRILCDTSLHDTMSRNAVRWAEQFTPYQMRTLWRSVSNRSVAQ